MFVDLRMYSPAEDIEELRAKGLPWVVATCLVVVVLLSGIAFYFLFTAEIISDQVVTTLSPPYTYQANSSEMDKTGETLSESSSPHIVIPSGMPKILNEWSQLPRGTTRRFLHAAVSCRNEFCAEIGRDVLIRGGNAVDSAIATAVCAGAVHPHNSGFGGGMVMLIHKRASNETTIIGGYTSAPRSATEATFLFNPKLAKIGYSSIAAPGFLHGIWTALKRFGSGRIGWMDLLMPSVYLVGRGIPISRDFAGAIKDRFNEIISEKSMVTAYNVALNEGDVFVDHVHSEFLRRLSLSRDPVEMFYRGEVAYQIVNEMKERGGLLGKFDLAGYEATVERAQETVFPNGFILKGPPSPSAFLAISLIVEIMMSRYSNRSNVSFDAMYLRELLAAQRAGLMRLEQIGDPDFMPDDLIVNNLRSHLNETGFLNEEEDVTNLMKNLKDQSQSSVGSHINVIDRDGLAVSFSSSLNSKFGSIRRSSRGGFVWNNDMWGFNILDDEDAEDGHVNSVAGRKRPRTSMAPFMLFDERGQLVSSFGIIGSVNSILAAAQVLLNQMLFNKDSVSSIEAPRIFTNSAGASFEIGFPARLLSELSSEVSLSPLLFHDSMVHSLEVLENNVLEAICDFRDNVDLCAKGF